MVVLDADSGKVITTAPIGERVDAAAYDPGTKLVFQSTGGGTIAVFHQDSRTNIRFLKTSPPTQVQRPWASIPKRIISSCPRI